MELGTFVIQLIFVLAETCILVRFLSNSLYIKEKFNFLKIVLMILLLQLIQRQLFIEIGLLSIIPSVVADLFVASIGFEGKTVKKVFLLSLFYAYGILFDTLSVSGILILQDLFFHQKINLEILSFAAIVLSKILLFVTVSFAGYSLRIDDVGYWFQFLPSPIITTITLMFGVPFGNEIANIVIPRPLFIICAFSFFANFYLIVSINKTAQKMQLHYRLKVINETRKMDAIHYYELKDAYKRLDFIAHDINHHLSYLRTIDNVIGVKEYIDTLSKRNTYKSLKFTGNLDIDTILNAKYSQMKDKGIRLNITSILPSTIDWLNVVDLVIILGNALENAIEACEAYNGLEIDLDFKYSVSFLLITIENAAGHFLESKEGGFGYVSRKKGEHHGLGMESMAASVALYDGLICSKVEDSVFTLEIILKNVQSGWEK